MTTVDGEWLCELVIAAWRMDRLASICEDASTASQLRYVARRLNALLAEVDAEAVDLTGQLFAEGLAVEVVDAPLAPSPRLRIREMVSPIVQVSGQVVRFGQVTVQPEEMEAAPRE
jgi:hypothetical protein